MAHNGTLGFILSLVHSASMGFNCFLGSHLGVGFQTNPGSQPPCGFHAHGSHSLDGFQPICGCLYRGGSHSPYGFQRFIRFHTQLMGFSEIPVHIHVLGFKGLMVHNFSASAYHLCPSQTKSKAESPPSAPSTSPYLSLIPQSPYLSP